MARMIPNSPGPSGTGSDTTNGPTQGERTVFEFLRRVLADRPDWTVWYGPVIPGRKGGGLEPDFVILAPEYGLFALEVKDWNLGQIEHADRLSVQLRKGQRTERLTNPAKQCMNYVNALQSLQKDRGITHRAGPHSGKAKLPVAALLAFPNISRAEFMQPYGVQLEDVLDKATVFTADDLCGGGSVISGEPVIAEKPITEGSAAIGSRDFVTHLRNAQIFPASPLGPEETEKLERALWPEFNARIPKREGSSKQDFAGQVIALDRNQWRMAKNLGPGHRIIQGAPGTGKTLVLVQRCKILLQNNPAGFRVRILCFNIALAAYVERLVLEQGVPVGPNAATAQHFYALCGEVLGETIDDQSKDSGYYADIRKRCLDMIDKGNLPFPLADAVLVDEGQDFNDEMFRIVLGVLRPDGDLVIALDGNQRLYRRKQSWKSLGIDATGRSGTLSERYRNTREIRRFYDAFLGSQSNGKEQQLGLFGEEAVEHSGPPPEVIRKADLTEMVRFVTQDIRDVLDKKEYRASEIAVIYDDKHYGKNLGPDRFEYAAEEMVEELLTSLRGAAIPVKWVSENAAAKRHFDITTDRVSLISVHSAKGLDFDLVYVLGAGRLDLRGAEEHEARRLLYVAMSRARHRLVIPYTRDTSLTRELHEALESVQSAAEVAKTRGSDICPT